MVALALRLTLVDLDDLLARLATHHVQLVLLRVWHNLTRVNLVVILCYFFKAITDSILTLIDLHHTR